MSPRKLTFKGAAAKVVEQNRGKAELLNEINALTSLVKGIRNGQQVKESMTGKRVIDEQTILELTYNVEKACERVSGTFEQKEVVFMLHKAYADFLFDTRKMKEAIGIFHRLKVYTQRAKMYGMKIGVYEQLGYCY